jgi:hypothetical protein
VFYLIKKTLEMSSNSDISWKSGPSKGDIPDTPKQGIIDTTPQVPCRCIITKENRVYRRNEVVCLWPTIDTLSGIKFHPSGDLTLSTFDPSKPPENKYLPNEDRDFNMNEFMNELDDILKQMLIGKATFELSKSYREDNELIIYIDSIHENRVIIYLYRIVVDGNVSYKVCCDPYNRYPGLVISNLPFAKESVINNVFILAFLIYSLSG